MISEIRMKIRWKPGAQSTSSQEESVLLTATGGSGWHSYEVLTNIGESCDI